MILTQLFKHLNIDLSDEKSIADIDHTLLKRMQASTRAYGQPPPFQPQAPLVSGFSSSSVDPYAALMTQV